jgi:hypothetical protein
MDLDKAESAKSLLRELLYKTREKSHAGSLPGAGGGLCGLGDPVELFRNLGNDLGPALQNLFRDRTGVDRETATRLIEGWIKEQDGLDRERNHFLKKFRHEHGFDRRQYGPELEKRFNEGVAAINDRQNQSLDRAAQQLVRILESPKQMNSRTERRTPPE